MTNGYPGVIESVNGPFVRVTNRLHRYDPDQSTFAPSMGVFIGHDPVYWASAGRTVGSSDLVVGQEVDVMFPSTQDLSQESPRFSSPVAIVIRD